MGRFLTVDPLAEKYPSLSPFVYCANNPIMLFDPDGNYILDSKLKANTKFMKVIERLTNFCENVPRVQEKFNELNTNIDDFLTPGKGPKLIGLVQVNAGIYRNISLGYDCQTITLANDLIEKLSNAEKGKETHYYEAILIITLLHETAHWAWTTKLKGYSKGKGESKKDRPIEPYEMGRWIEGEIFSKGLEYDADNIFSPNDNKYWKTYHRSNSKSPYKMWLELTGGE